MNGEKPTVRSELSVQQVSRVKVSLPSSDQELDSFLVLLDGHSVDPAGDTEKSRKWVNLQIFWESSGGSGAAAGGSGEFSALHVCTSDRCGGGWGVGGAAATSSPRGRGSSPGGTRRKPARPC